LRPKGSVHGRIVESLRSQLSHTPFPTSLNKIFRDLSPIKFFWNQLSDIVSYRSAREDFEMTAQYNKKQKQKRRKAKVERKKAKVREAIAKANK
jgi:hypothetical protein